MKSEAAKQHGESFIGGRKLISKDFGDYVKEIADALDEEERERKRRKTSPTESEADSGKDELQDFAGF